jgi:PAT family beta-lactamase induction signal transducer AmpG
VSLAERRWLRLFTLCSLYVAQGIPFGFMATTLPTYIKTRGSVSEAVLGSALAMTTLPYTFKWIWGPLMDVITIPSLGRRRPWIMFAQLMMAVTVIAMVAIPDVTTDLELLAWMILIHTVFNSMQDVAVDALAVDLLDDDERGRANGLMYACKYGGVVIGGAGMGRVIEAYDLNTALIVQTAILSAIMLVPLLVRERSGPPPTRPAVREIFQGLAQVATLRSTLFAAVLMLCLNVAIGTLYIAGIGLYTSELGWDATDYTDLVGGIQPFVGFGASILGGFLADLVGAKRMTMIASVAIGVGWLIFAVAQPLWTDTLFVYSIAIWDVACMSVMLVSSYALCMAVSWPRVAATQFAAYMALANMSSTIGYKLGGVVLDYVTYRELYVIAGLVQLAVPMIALLVDPGEARRTLPLQAGWRIGPYTVAMGLVFVGAVVVAPVALLLLR